MIVSATLTFSKELLNPKDKLPQNPIISIHDLLQNISIEKNVNIYVHKFSLMILCFAHGTPLPSPYENLQRPHRISGTYYLRLIVNLKVLICIGVSWTSSVSMLTAGGKVSGKRNKYKKQEYFVKFFSIQQQLLNFRQYNRGHSHVKAYGDVLPKWVTFLSTPSMISYISLVAQ